MHTMAQLGIGEDARVESLLQSNIRERLKVLGLVPGAAVTPLHRSPLGDPTAYRIWGAVIALRDADASTVLVTPEVMP